jgi:hypothetical protein
LDIVQDGDTFYKTTQDEKTGAARAYTGFDANSTIITSVLPGADPSVQSGLNLTQTYLGYYNGAEWMSYMSIDGHFYLGGVDGAIQWNGSTLLIGGDSQLIFGTRIIPGANILSPDVRLWHETTVPSGIGYWTEGSNPYGYDPYGSGEENNSIISTLNPFGYQDLVWECNVVSGGEEAGGWAYNTYDIDKTLRYRHTIWAKFIGGIGRDMFFGCGNTGHTSDLTFDDSDSVNNNPYFASGLELPNAIHFNDNPVANPSMELDANWNAYGNPISSQRSAASKLDGTYSWYCDLWEADVGSGVKSDEFTLEGYQTYRFSIWLDSVSKTTKWQIYIDNGEQRYWIKELGYENSYITYDDWTNHVVTFQTAERSTTNRIYVIASEVDTSAGVYIDAVEVSTQLIVNGSMDDGAFTGTRLTGWTYVGNPSSHDTSSEQAHSGTYSRKVVAEASGDGLKTDKYTTARGGCTETLAGKLVDSGANFISAGVAINDLVYNMSKGEGTYVTAVNTETELSVYDDIFEDFNGYLINSNKSYLKIMAGYQYRASIWLYGDAVTEWEAKVSDGISDYDFLETDNTPVLVPSGIWTNYMLDFEAENNTEEGYLSVTNISVSGSAAIYIDDVEFQETPWYLLTGFVHPDDYVGTDSWGGLYHYKSGYSPPTYSGIDYKSLDATTVQGFRCFQKNSNDEEENKLLLYSPAVHVVDGSEPSLSAVLGNSLNMAWNVEHTTSISRYLLSSPTIRGGNYAGGNYVQMDAYGLRAFGNNVNTFLIDSLTGSVSIKSSESGQRLEIDGIENTISFYDSSNDLRVFIDDSISGELAGIKVFNGIFFASNPDGFDSSSLKHNRLSVNNYTTTTPSIIQLLNVQHDFPIFADTIDGLALDVYIKDDPNYDYTGERVALRAWSDVNISNTRLDAIGIHGWGTNEGNGIAIGGRFESTDIAVRLEYDATHYADFKVNTIGDDSYLTITPNSADGGSISMRGALGSSMFLIQFDDDTVYAGTTLSNLPGMRIHNASTTTGTQCGIHFSSPSAYAGIFGINGAASNQQGIGFYTEDDTRSVKMELTHDGNLIHKDILYPEITVGGSDSARTFTVDVCDMNGVVTDRIGNGDGIDGANTRGVVEWWVSETQFGAPTDITGERTITFSVSTGTGHGVVDETARNVATTDVNGRVVVTSSTDNNDGETAMYFHVRIGAGIAYSSTGTIYRIDV